MVELLAVLWVDHLAAMLDTQKDMRKAGRTVAKSVDYLAVLMVDHLVDLLALSLAVLRGVLTVAQSVEHLDSMLARNSADPSADLKVGPKVAAKVDYLVDS